MLKLSKKVEYALIAVRHMAWRGEGTLCTAKDISDRYHVPYDLLAKVLQKLVKSGLVNSVQGVYGGYCLSRAADQITISNVINAIEGHTPAITQCIADNPQSCSIFDSCTIKNPLERIQHNIEDVFKTMKVSEIV